MESNAMDRLREVATARKDIEEQASQRIHQEASKKRLLVILTKKLRTSFIGAISQFETHFGELWGHGKDESECTPHELEWREIWQLCRTDVLTNGNNQLRAMQAEILEYTIVWNMHRMQIPVANKRGKL